MMTISNTSSKVHAHRPGGRFASFGPGAFGSGVRLNTETLLPRDEVGCLRRGAPGPGIDLTDTNGGTDAMLILSRYVDESILIGETISIKVISILGDKVKLGVDWATQVVTTVPADTLRATTSRHRGTPFWRHVIQVLPRGAWVDEHDPRFIHYTLEASLWMLYYEVLTHLYTIQRLKRAQGLSTRVVLPRVGYLTLPEYTGEAASPGPSFVPLR